MIKKVGISLSVEENHHLCELSNIWNKKKSNIIGDLIKNAGVQEGIIYTDIPDIPDIPDINTSDKNIDGINFSIASIKEQLKKLKAVKESLREIVNKRVSQGFDIKTNNLNIKTRKRLSLIENKIVGLQSLIDNIPTDDLINMDFIDEEEILSEELIHNDSKDEKETLSDEISDKELDNEMLKIWNDLPLKK